MSHENMKNTYWSKLNVRQEDAANTENTTKYMKAAISTDTDDENCFKGTLKSYQHGWVSLLCHPENISSFSNTAYG